ncbi:MAG: DUF3987 domain-containing protein [Bacteroidaceae bacterium]|nr:DUF3987 domain-containing protein [Bacteroidaceae bacterium]
MVRACLARYRTYLISQDYEYYLENWDGNCQFREFCEVMMDSFGEHELYCLSSIGTLQCPLDLPGEFCTPFASELIGRLIPYYCDKNGFWKKEIVLSFICQVAHVLSGLLNIAQRRKWYYFEKIWHVDIMSPKLSTVLSGTPGQLQALVRDAEDGLFSRFILYKLDTGVYWKDVFAASDRPSLNRRFAWLGERFAVFYRQLEECGPMEFKLTYGQAQRFNIHFSGAQMDFNLLYGDGIIASVRRLGLICYRIAMILSVVRMMEDGIPRGLVVCRDVDFETAMTITQVLESHTAQIYEELRGKGVSVGAGRPDCRERGFWPSCRMSSLGRGTPVLPE